MPDTPHRVCEVDYDQLLDAILDTQIAFMGVLNDANAPQLQAIVGKLSAIRTQARQTITWKQEG